MFTASGYKINKLTSGRYGIAEDAIVVVKGRADARDDTVKLIASDLVVPDLSEGPRGPVVVRMPTERCTPPMINRLREVLAAHPGTTEVHLRLVRGERPVPLERDPVQDPLAEPRGPGDRAVDPVGADEDRGADPIAANSQLHSVRSDR